jgi:hypothetical protein
MASRILVQSSEFLLQKASGFSAGIFSSISAVAALNTASNPAGLNADG